MLKSFISGLSFIKRRQGWRGGWRQTNKGNVLFLILIAVMLFAALTAAITKSEQGGSSMTKERSLISASDYMSYASNIEKAVGRMLSQDISENQLSFSTPNWLFNDGTRIETDAMFTSCTTASCKVFNPGGGGIEAKTFTDNQPASPAANDIKSGHAGVFSLKITGVGTADYDLVLLIAVLDTDTCKAINNQLKIVNPGDHPPIDSWAGATLYGGGFTGPGNATDEIGDMATEVVGKSAGCVRRDSGPYGASDNWFYQVLLPR